MLYILKLSTIPHQLLLNMAFINKTQTPGFLTKPSNIKRWREAFVFSIKASWGEAFSENQSAWVCLVKNILFTLPETNSKSPLKING